LAPSSLSWILKDNWPSRVALQQLAARHDIGVVFTNFVELVRRLGDRPRLADLTANMRAAGDAFAFETHVEDLSTFFRSIIARHEHAPGAAALITVTRRRTL